MDKPKTLAIYLPQFHQIPENDKWWGEGFTEWTAVKSAVPLFEGHNQPRVPLDNNYYNLSEKSTMQWQAELAEKYGIDGFCFYHYWFKEGKKILEKPAENLLKWKEINIPFCFSWANETWARSWSKMERGNSWSERFEKKDEAQDNESGILLEQKYGEEDQWRKHFEYLLPFFSDKRYITVDGKPVFILHRPEIVPCLEPMLGFWRKLALSSGLPGLYLIGRDCLGQSYDVFDAVVFQTTVDNKDSKNKVESIRSFSYQESWDFLISVVKDSKKKVYGCGYVDYDDTPRRGKRGFFMSGSSAFTFYKNFRRLYEVSVEKENEFVFLNAWNEWGEGMYLEPDRKNGYTLLEAVKEAQVAPLNKGYEDKNEISIMHENVIEQMLQRQNELAKFKTYFELLSKWLYLKSSGKGLAQYLILKNIYTVAIYGMGVLGMHLLNEFKNSSVEVIYGIDRFAETINIDLTVYEVCDSLPEVNAVIITPVQEYSYIKRQLISQPVGSILSLEEILKEVN